MERPCQPQRGLHILGGGQCQAAGMVVGQYHRNSIGIQCGFHNSADGNTGRIHTAFANFFTSQHFTLGIQAQQIYRLILQRMEIRHHVFAASLCCGENSGIRHAVTQVEPSHSIDHSQISGDMLRDTADLHQFLRGSIQHAGELSEMIQQSMGQGIGILPLHTVKQHQLQHIHFIKIIQAFC